MGLGLLCNGQDWASRIGYVIDFDAPVTIVLVVTCSVVMLGNWATSAGAECNESSLGFHVPVPPPPPAAPQPSPYAGQYDDYGGGETAYDVGGGGGYGQSDPLSGAATELVAVVPEPEPEPEPDVLLLTLQDKIGCGLNSWLFTCYSHTYYTSFRCPLLQVPPPVAWAMRWYFAAVVLRGGQEPLRLVRCGLQIPHQGDACARAVCSAAGSCRASGLGVWDMSISTSTRSKPCSTPTVAGGAMWVLHGVAPARQRALPAAWQCNGHMRSHKGLACTGEYDLSTAAGPQV
jgi:hypothetical protein